MKQSHKDAIRAARTGTKHSDETRAKISKTLRGKKRGPYKTKVTKLDP